MPHITCAAHPEQSYALYLPSNYSPDRLWPLIVSSDPGGRGTVPLVLQKDASERYGFVLASSNNSRNGPWKPYVEATEALLNDVQARASIDAQRVYFAGFSGGARASSQFATLCKCSAGVLLSGAGFSNGLEPTADSIFPVFSAVGTADFNYKEMIPLQEALVKTGFPRWLRIFEGRHEWPPPEVLDEALAWFRMQGMKAHLEAPDAKFIQAQFAKAESRALGFERSSNPLSAWREYAQIAATYELLADVTSIRARAEALGKDKAVRDAVKREQNEFREQDRLTSEISSRLFATPGTQDNRLESDPDLQFQITRLHQNAEQEKHPERARVFQRALGDVFVRAMETGNSLLEQKKMSEAIRIFEFAALAMPESEWAWEQLAVARALAGRKKDAIAALRQAQVRSTDKHSFAKWLQSETAFDVLRSTPDFQQLTKSN